ncbi:hypothetical protein [Yersinia pseudotuberculosis]|uniref:hypothetical protein n=1 Tax=Yersinia pseudotuberculosis TaxID=633 RepID=UPI0005DEAE9E|nr:hypothetical protein [Yersinia pseudotuberculosis]CFV21508.1 Uncharacterised protein [Yersinia pseudotuberculosis]
MKKRELTIRELAGLMLNKSMNYGQIATAISLNYPDCEMPIEILRIRVRSMVMSPHVNIPRRNGRKTTYTLNNITEEFIRLSESRNKRCCKREPKRTSTRLPFDEKERVYCLRISIIDQLLRNVRLAH